VSEVSKPALVFIGFMGAGKSTALAAAREAGLATTEIDALMEAELGMPIAEAFERHGEEGFREREAEVVGALLEEAEGGAIALGGGSILSERIRAALGRHIVVWLQVDAAEAWRRIAHSSRPLATSAADVARLLAIREPLYEQLADAVIPVGDRFIVNRALPSVIALTDLPAGTKMIWATSPSGEYPVLVGRGLLESGWWPLEGRRFCISDEAVAPLYAERLAPLAATIAVEPGEGAKTMAEAERVLRALASAGMTREDHVVALGGGVVGDLAGFCAHLYQRGVPVVQVPTTLVAQVDSAYGGKTGVDLPEGKNYAGAYHQPAAVLVDPGTLASLPPEELAAGWAEVIKTGLIAGGELWRRVRGRVALAPDRDLVLACARVKLRIVARDERDAGERQVLNLGHTVGHAIETVTGYERYRHGEAVGLGLLAALTLSERPELRDEVADLLAARGLPTRLDPAVDRDAVAAAVQRDKKRRGGRVGFVLLDAPGSPRTGCHVSADDLAAAIAELAR
jgi:shikimate kinase/3-dehydroquinate synthase